MNFDRELDARKSEIIESMQELIRIRSVGEEAGAHPFGGRAARILMALPALGERLGFRTAVWTTWRAIGNTVRAKNCTVAGAS